MKKRAMKKAVKHLALASLLSTSCALAKEITNFSGKLTLTGHISPSCKVLVNNALTLDLPLKIKETDTSSKFELSSICNKKATHSITVEYETDENGRGLVHHKKGNVMHFTLYDGSQRPLLNKQEISTTNMEYKDTLTVAYDSQPDLPAGDYYGKITFTLKGE